MGALVGGAGGALIGIGVLKQPRNVLGTEMSPAVLGTLGLGIGGLAGYYLIKRFGRGMHDTAAKVSLFAGVAGLGAFSAALASAWHTASRTGQPMRASFGEAGYEAAYEATGIPEERVLSYQSFTGPANPILSPNYYVTVLD